MNSEPHAPPCRDECLCNWCCYFRQFVSGMMRIRMGQRPSGLVVFGLGLEKMAICAKELDVVCQVLSPVKPDSVGPTHKVVCRALPHDTVELQIRNLGAPVALRPEGNNQLGS